MSKLPKMNTKVLSTRIPVDVMTAIDSICKEQGVNRSQWLTTTVVTHQSNDFYKDGGALQARTIPKEIQDLLIAGGVSTAGIFTYSLVNKALERQVDENGKPKFTHAEIEFISIVTGVAIAVAGFGLVKALLAD